MKRWEWTYNALIHAGVPLAVAGTYGAFSGRDPDRNTSARFMESPQPPSGVKLWLHGASVGEMQIVRRLRDWAIEEGLDKRSIFITSQTLSGLESIDHPTSSVLPADYPGLLQPLTRAVGQAPLIIVETELWPNLFRCSRGPVHLFNAHMKPDSYEWYCRFRGLFRETLEHCESVNARSEQEARRFRVLCPPERRSSVTTIGDLKWTKFLDRPDPSAIDGPRFSGEQPVLVAGSTWEGEEERVIELAESLQVRVYLAPRHMDRLDGVETILDRSDLRWCRWTEATGSVDHDVVLVDTIGVLATLYGLGDAVFVGGSWVEGVGGHDLLEPARYGVPVFVGPHISNVESTARELERAGLLSVLHSRSDWHDHLGDTLSDHSPATEVTGYGKLHDRAERIHDQYRSLLKSILEGRGIR